MAIVVPVVSTWDGSGVNRAIKDISKAETRLEQFGAVGKSMTNLGRAMTVGLTLPIAAAGVAATKAAAEFEVSMRTFQTVTGAAGSEMKKVEKLAKELGQETVFSTQEAATAMLELGKAGLSVDEILAGGAAAAVHLAATESMDLAYAAEITAQAMNAFNIEGDEAGRVADALAQAAIDSTASVGDLAYGLKYVSASAAALGIPLEDTVAALGLLNNAGLTGTTAGTSLNQMFNAMAGPTKQAAEAMEDLGFSAFDATGTLKPMDQIIGELNGALAGLSDEERQGALKKIFNQRGMRAANILLKDGVDGWNEFADGIRNSAGAAEELANARMGGLYGSLEQLRGAVENMGIAFGTALAPAVQTVAGWLKSLADWFTNLSPGMQKAIAAGLAFVAVLGPIILMAGLFISAITSIISVVGAVAGAIGIAAGALLGWIAVIALVIAAVVAIGVIIYKNWDKIKKFTIQIWNSIVQWFKQQLENFKNAFPETFAAIVAFVKVFWNTVKAIFIGYFGAIWAFVKGSFIAGKAIIEFYLTLMWNIFKAGFRFIWESVKTTMTQIFVIIETILKVIKAAFTGNWREIPKIVGDGVKKVFALFVEFPGKIKNILGDMTKVLYSAGKDLIKGLMNGINAMWQSLKSTVSKVLDVINPFKSSSVAISSPSAPRTAAAGLSAYGMQSAVPTSMTTPGNVAIYISDSENPNRTARLVKRAIEGYDIGQGRRPAEPLARAW